MSYLDTYGVGDARREKLFKKTALAVVVLLIAGLVGYFQFRNYPEERLVTAFLGHIRARDYKAAYALWGCTDAKPCPQYPMDKFMEDWGPAGPVKDPQQARVADSRGCDTGLISFVSVPGQDTIHLWVDRQTHEIGFAPWQLKPIPPGFRTRLAAWIWDLAQDCKPLIAP